jgi:hypothetical protein
MKPAPQPNEPTVQATLETEMFPSDLMESTDFTDSPLFQPNSHSISSADLQPFQPLDPTFECCLSEIHTKTTLAGTSPTVRAGLADDDLFAGESGDFVKAEDGCGGLGPLVADLPVRWTNGSNGGSPSPFPRFDTPNFVPRLPIHVQTWPQSPLRREPPKKKPKSLSDDKPSSGPAAIPSGVPTNCKRRRRRAKREDERDGDGDDDYDDDDKGASEDAQHGRRKSARPRQKENEILFACPYYKRDPIRYSICLKFALRRIKDVKQHIYRKHARSAFYCAFCWADFGDEQSRDHHVRARRCEPRERAPAGDGISVDQKNQLHKKIYRSDSTAEQWFRIWDIVFPAVPKPADIYLGSHVEEAVAMVRVIWRDKGRSIMESVAGEEAEASQLPAGLLGRAMDRLLAEFQKESRLSSGKSLLDEGMSEKSAVKMDTPVASVVTSVCCSQAREDRPCAPSELGMGMDLWSGMPPLRTMTPGTEWEEVFSAF